MSLIVLVFFVYSVVSGSPTALQNVQLQCIAYCPIVGVLFQLQCTFHTLFIFIARQHVHFFFTRFHFDCSPEHRSSGSDAFQSSGGGLEYRPHH